MVNIEFKVKLFNPNTLEEEPITDNIMFRWFSDGVLRAFKYENGKSVKLIIKNYGE